MEADTCDSRSATEECKPSIEASFLPRTPVPPNEALSVKATLSPYYVFKLASMLKRAVRELRTQLVISIDHVLLIFFYTVTFVILRVSAEPRVEIRLSVQLADLYIITDLLRACLESP
jgi:hypothetical protein